MIEAEAMSLPYAVPLGDIRFALLHAAGSDDLENGVVEDDLVDQIVLEAGRFAAERLIPLNLSGDQVGARFAGGAVVTPPGFREAFSDWTAGGWMSVALPGEWGGTGLPPVVSAPLDEIWNGANMAFYVCPTLTQAAFQLLLAHGSEAQKRLYRSEEHTYEI